MSTGDSVASTITYSMQQDDVTKACSRVCLEGRLPMAYIETGELPPQRHITLEGAPWHATRS